jgi:hypothetical protein
MAEVSGSISRFCYFQGNFCESVRNRKFFGFFGTAICQPFTICNHGHRRWHRDKAVANTSQSSLWISLARHTPLPQSNWTILCSNSSSNRVCSSTPRVIWRLRLLAFFTASLKAVTYYFIVLGMTRTLRLMVPVIGRSSICCGLSPSSCLFVCLSSLALGQPLVP